MILFGREIPRSQIIIFGAIITIVILLGLVFFGIVGREEAPAQATLEFWGVYDDLRTWQPIFDEYRKSNPEVFFKYVKMDPETYERELLEGLASGKTPDIIAFHSSWLPKHGNKVSPMPQTIMTLRQFQETFPDVATVDFVAKGQVYAMPVWTDALAMVYNKDLFNTAGVANPPANWDEFIKVVQKLSAKDRFGNLTKSGAAIGAANNVNHAADLVSLLMMQAGAKMVSDDGREAIFDRSIRVANTDFLPGESALRFYTDFAKPQVAAYSWNDDQPNSLDAFASGKTAIIFEYSVNIPQIKQKAPNLRYGVAPMPQIVGASRAVNYADFWGYAVPLASKNPDAAWKFLAYLASYDINKYFGAAVSRPASRRDVIAEEISAPELGVFAQSMLSATNWYRVDPSEVERIFKEMINAVILSGAKPADAIRDAANKVTFIMQKQ